MGLTGKRFKLEGRKKMIRIQCCHRGHCRAHRGGKINALNKKNKEKLIVGTCKRSRRR